MLVSSLLLAFLLALLFNFKLTMEEEMQGFGFREIVAMPGQLLNKQFSKSMDLSSLLSVTPMNSDLTYQDAQNVKREVPDVTAAVPQSEVVTSANTGSTPAYTKVFSIPLAEGRWLNNADVKNEAQSMETRDSRWLNPTKRFIF